MRTLAILLTALFFLGLAACSSFRETVRETWNDEREGTKAPELDLSDVVWIGGSDADLAGNEWTVMVFFKPT